MAETWKCKVPMACKDASANDAGEDAPTDSSGDATDVTTDGGDGNAAQD